MKSKQKLKKILTFKLGLNESMTGFTAPPSTTDSTTPPSKCVPGQNFYHSQVEYTRTRVAIRLYLTGLGLIQSYAGDIVLSTDKQGLIAEIESMKNTAEKILESVPKQKEVVEKATSLLSDLNPIYKEKKETEQRFAKIEETINRMESTVTNFINSFHNGQGNSNTAQ